MTLGQVFCKVFGHNFNEVHVGRMCQRCGVWNPITEEHV